MKWNLCLLAFLLTVANVDGQGQKAAKNPVYVDKNGVMRWTSSGKEAAFFGVNYTVPFAYGYRSHKALGIDPEKAIDTDVAHMARLGFDAFRVHVWDTEISDSSGNLLPNEHLRLFDYLLMRLKQRGIKILITPLAFWGSGYPEPDPDTGSFSSIWNKQKVLVTEAAIKAQEAYLKQFFQHVNPYTQTTYGADPDVIAMEINNEPHHSGPKEGAMAYINRMAAAVRSTGWTKPIFYNISESPTYADAVVKAKVDGHSFQWYPTGLVANRTLQGNYLPNVDHYQIPFDTIPAFAKRARMVYEFDAGDVLASYMYPAMARSFREAGFQWATQFAYDPLYTAHANTEYQTHYLNLAYTPSKAISLMIAGKAFHRLPRLKSYGSYPADTAFDVFRVSYRQDLSEMNTPGEFYYSNTTTTKPVNRAALKHVAGVGSSALVHYDGTGAYFLDQVKPGVWRLEVLPDVFQVADPFGRASPQRTVRRLFNNERNMQVNLPDLGAPYVLIAVGRKAKQAGAAGFKVIPGTYLLVKEGFSQASTTLAATDVVYPAPPLPADSVLLTHTLPKYVAEGSPLLLEAFAAGSDSLMLEWRHPQQGWKNIPLLWQEGFRFSAQLPAEWLTAGPVEYRFLVRDRAGIVHAFPGDLKGDPYRWDAGPAQTWKTTVLPTAASQLLFDAAGDAEALSIFTANWEQHKIQYRAGPDFPYIWQIMQVAGSIKSPVLGWQLFIGDRIRHEIQFSKLRVLAKGTPGTGLKLILIDKDAVAYEAAVNGLSPEESWCEIPFADFKPAARLLLPRPYPGFQALYHQPPDAKPLQPAALDLLQVWMDAGASPDTGQQEVMLQGIYLQ